MISAYHWRGDWQMIGMGSTNAAVELRQAALWLKLKLWERLRGQYLLWCVDLGRPRRNGVKAVIAHWVPNASQPSSA